MLSLRFLPALAALLIVAACATPGGGALPSTDAPRRASFDLSARFALTSAGERYAGSLFWQRQGEVDRLQIVSPFGQTLAEIAADSAGARLVDSSGSVRSAGSADELLLAAIGLDLPLARLVSWLFAQADGATTTQRDALGRLSELRAAGWQVLYRYAAEAGAAAQPDLIVANFAAAGEATASSELRLRIVSLRAASALAP